MIFTSPRRVFVDGAGPGEASGSATSFRSRSSTTQALLHTAVGGGVGSGSGSGSRVAKVKSISTNPAQPCAGETETEADEPVCLSFRCLVFVCVFLWYGRCQVVGS